MSTKRPVAENRTPAMRKPPARPSASAKEVRQHGVMKNAKISELRDHLSAYLTAVRAGETVWFLTGTFPSRALNPCRSPVTARKAGFSKRSKRMFFGLPDDRPRRRCRCQRRRRAQRLRWSKLCWMSATKAHEVLGHVGSSAFASARNAFGEGGPSLPKRSRFGGLMPHGNRNPIGIGASNPRRAVSG